VHISSGYSKPKQNTFLVSLAGCLVDWLTGLWVGFVWFRLVCAVGFVSFSLGLFALVWFGLSRIFTVICRK
jgi:hypothetical protein